MTPRPRRLFRRAFLALGLLVPLLLPSPAPAQQAQHVVLVVWSGLRPDMVTESLTPTLFRLAQEGTLFSRHHAVFPTTPIVNGVSLLTGGYPGRHGIYADKAYLPGIDPTRPVGTGAPNVVRQADLATQGHYLTSPTLPELFQGAGWGTAVAGSGLVPYLADRRPAEAAALAAEEAKETNTSEAAPSADAPSPPAPTSFVAYAASVANSTAMPSPSGKGGPLVVGSSTPSSRAITLPAMLGPFLTKLLKPFPETITIPNLAQDRWMTRALIDGFWSKGVPKFSLLWLSDPASSVRAASPGENETLEAIRAQDENLRLLLQTLEKKGVRGKTDVFVASDTGYSTVVEGIDVAAELAKAGFNAVRKLKAPPAPPHKDGEEDAPPPKPSLAKGQILVAGHCGTVLFYVGGHDEDVTARLLSYLQRSRYAGVLFSREARDGTFTLHQANLATGDWESLPDLLLSFRWTGETNRYGVPGAILADLGAGGEAKRGGCGTLSRFDLHATLIASGPDIRVGFVDELPTGTADLAPTLAGLLRLESPPWMDGRVLVEAIRDFPAGAGEIDSETLVAVAGSWRQSLRVSRLGGSVYFEEGNGSGNNRGGVGAP